MGWITQFVIFIHFYSGILSAYGSLPAQITKAIDTATVSVGQEGKLNCTVAGRRSGRAAVLWSKVDGGMIARDDVIIRRNPLNAEGQQKYRITVTVVSATVEVFTLAVRRVVSEDSGMYECKLYMTGLDNIEDFPMARGQMIVQLPPSIGDSETTAFVRVVEGDSAVMTCDASGVPPPVISWSRANGNALPDGRQTVYGIELKVSGAHKEDGGVYRCKADNNVRPPATMDITLQVFTKPAARAFRKSYGQAPDKNLEVELACIISGEPTPDVKWHYMSGKNLVPINDDYKHEINKIAVYPGHKGKANDMWMTLRIFQVQQNDYGNYTCTGINRYGSGHAVITLYNTPTCQGPTCAFETYDRNSAGRTSNLWTVSALILVISRTICKCFL